MPDLQSELTKIMINQWDVEEQSIRNTKEKAVTQNPSHFKTTNNATRATFNAIKDNPGLSRRGIRALLVPQGYKDSSASSLILQMLNQSLVRETDDNRLYAMVPEYIPLKSGKHRHVLAENAKKLRKARQARLMTPRKEEIEAAPKVAHTLMASAPVQPPAPAPVDDVVALLDTLTLRQARALFVVLAKMFKE